MNQQDSKFSKLSNLDVVLLALKDLVGKIFLADRPAISTAFYNLRGNYKELIDRIGGFSKGDFFPESESLDWALTHLNYSGIIGMYMDVPSRYVFDKEPRIIERYNTIDSVLTDKEKIEIMDFSKEFIREYLKAGGKIIS